MLKLPEILNTGKNYWKKFMYKYDELQIMSGFNIHKEVKDFKDMEYPFFYLNVLIKGDVTFVNKEGVEFLLKPGDVVFRHPNRKHSIKRRNIEPGLEFVIRLPIYIYENLVGLGMIYSDTYVINAGMDQLLVDRFVEFTEQLGRFKPNELSLLIIEFQILLYYLKSRQERIGKNEETEKKINHACQLLVEDFDKKIIIPDIARKVGLGYELFRKEFRRLVGISPQEFRIRSRVEEADNMIRSERWTLVEVAEQLGYPDYATFAKQYKKFTGHPPGAIKKKDVFSLLQ